MNRTPLRRHHDDDYWDRVTIQAATGANFVAFIRPRWKSSGLSGDEWRISAVVEVRRHPGGEPTIARTFHRMRNVLEYAAYFVYSGEPQLFSSPEAVLTVERKGHVLMREVRPTLGDALIGLGWHIITAIEGREDVQWNHLTDEQERVLCQQVGCRIPPVVTYRLKKLQSESVMVKPEYNFIGQYVWYCERHRLRGDCGLEDADVNLVEVTSLDVRQAPPSKGGALGLLGMHPSEIDQLSLGRIAIEIAAWAVFDLISDDPLSFLRMVTEWRRATEVARVKNAGATDHE